MSAVDNLIKQILASSNTSRWTGEGFGSAEKNAADMAKILAEAGITDIKQLGVKQEVIPAMYFESGETPEQTVNVYYNKETGQQLGNTYGERQTGNFFGGTFTGKGNTGYGVQFKPDGTPVFYTQGASSNDLADIMKMAGPAGQLGLAIATGGLTIPQQIAAKFAMNVLSGQDVGDAIKGAAASYAISNLPGMDVMKESSKLLNKLDDTGVLSSAFKNSVMSGAGALLTGKDVGQAMLAGAATGGVNGALNALMDTSEFKDLTKDLSASQKKMVINAATGVMSGKPIDQIIINSAMSAAKDAALKAQTENQVLDPYFKSMGSKVAGADDSITLPSGIQLAGTTNDIFSDAGNGVFKMEGGGPPLFAESKGADALKLPFGTRLMSSNEEVEEVDPDTGRTVYKKPENSYYDPTLNAWLVKEDASQMFNASSFLNDMALFNSSQGDLKDVASKTDSTSDDYLADFLKSMGITSTDDLYVRELSPQDILDMIGYTGDGVDTVKVTDKRLTDAAEDLTVANKNLTNNTNVADAGTLNVTDKRVADAGTIDVTDKRITPVGGTEELVMTAKRPILDEVTTDIDRIKANEITLDDLTSDADTKVDKKVDNKVTPKTTPATVTIPTTTADTPYVPTGQAPPPSQDPYAKVKFMEDIFGPELSNQFLTDVSMQTPKTNDLEALLRLLRG
jgi:hypothetical protein